MKHKNLKRPTRGQKELIAVHGLNWENWLVHNEDNISLAIVNKTSGSHRVLLK